MVGVPGRSKGCHTCRRRKIKCDLAKPNCEKCTKSGRDCEGYARGAVFLNRTPQGMLKREHLEEAEPRNQPSGQSYHPAPETPRRSILPSSASSSSDSDRSPSPGYDLYAIVPDVKVLTAGLENYYVTRFVPLDSRHGGDTCGIWSMKALGIVNRGEALDNAFAALAFNRAGRDQNDRELVTQGREAYGRALLACSKSLHDPRAVKSDQLLAACNLLKTYEIQEATSNSTDGHDRHIQGLTDLILRRGKEVLRSEHNRFLINEVRFSAMILALQYRKRSPLGAKEWSPKAWKSPSDVQQSLYDCGFTLAGIAEDMDGLSQKPKSEITPEVVRAFSARILAVHGDLKRWHQKLLQEAQLQLDWPNGDALPSDSQYESPYDEPVGESRIRVSLLWQRLMMMDFWTLRIGVCIVLKNFEQEMMIRGPGQIGPERSLADIMLSLAENITRTAPLCLPSSSGIYGQSRTIYAIRVGIIPSRMFDTPRAEALRQQFDALMAIVSSKAAKNVTAVSTLSDAWRNTVKASDHAFVKSP